MTNENRKRLVNTAAQQAENAFEQFGFELSADQFNELHDHIEALLDKVLKAVEDGPAT